MQKIKEIYNKGIEYIKNINSVQKKYLALAVALIIILAIGFQIVYIKSQTTQSELAVLLDSGINYLNEAKKIKDQYVNKEIYEGDYNKREKEIEIAVEEIVKKLYEAKLGDDVKVDKKSLESIGDGLQIMLYVMRNSPNLKDINDEILALSILMEDIKSGI